MPSEFAPLKLLARDEEDLTIMAAHLQDALLPLAAMMYDPQSSTFTVLANRFCWEQSPIGTEGEQIYHRVHSGLCFHNVDVVRRRGFNRKDAPEILSLLTLEAQKTQAIHLVCAGNKEIRIETKNLHCQMGDLHHPWPTSKRPTHLYEHVERMQAAVS